MEIKKVPLSLLNVFDLNPRKHGEDVDAIVKSIQRFGWTNPILVQKGTNRIIAGHGRAEAALKAGLKEVPVIELEMDDRDATAYTVADNKIAELSSWDQKALKEILVGLDDGAFDLELTGFPEVELGALIERAAVASEVSPADPPKLFEQIVFVVTKEQLALIGYALDAAAKSGPFEGTGNQNQRGNALARIAEAYRGKNGSV